MSAAGEERSQPPVTVAVVSWNTRGLLSSCLRSLRPEVDAGLASVWVVDNASSDGSAELVRREAPWAALVETGENLGFGRAVDLVARRTKSPWLAPANADVALTAGALSALIAAGEDPRTAVVAPRLVLPDGRTQQSVHHFPTLPFTLAFNLGARRLGRRLGNRLCLEGHWDPERPRTVDWAIGALLLVRRSAFEEVGGFDAQQWMYAEDLDLCWRLARVGYEIRYEPRAVVLHHASAATLMAFGGERVEHFMAATYSVLARRRGPLRAWATAALNWLGAAARLAWIAPLARAHPRWRPARDLHRTWLRAHRKGLGAGGGTRILRDASWPKS